MKRLLFAALFLAGCSSNIPGALDVAVPAISEHISPQLVTAAYAKCLSELDSAKEVNLQKLQQAEHLLGAMETALQNRQLVGALRLEVERVCGELDSPEPGDALEDLREQFRRAATEARQ